MWFNLTQVCGRWRAVMFAASFRLDLGFTMRPEKPGNIETLLSGPLPIFINFGYMYQDTTGIILWRMRAALKHHDRVRGISFQWTSGGFNEFLKATNCPFPILDSLILDVSRHSRHEPEPKLPDTFFRGQDPSDLHLRHLELYNFSLASISRFLSFATGLTNLCLLINTAFSPSPETSLVACLQGMPCLRRLDLTISSDPLKSPSGASSPQHITSLSKLTYFRYAGHNVFLDALVGGQPWAISPISPGCLL